MCLPEKRQLTRIGVLHKRTPASAGRLHSEQEEAMTQDAAPYTILLVEHDEGTVTTYARILRLEGYIVRTALSAEAGLHEVESSHPDAVILDFRMPDMDGLEFLRRLREDGLRNMPVAIVTGDYFLDERVPKELKQLGAEIRFKPLWVEDLTKLARELVNGTPPTTA
jgi:two-component system OmpR family response regulator